MHILLELFLVFAKIGLFTFGGGYAMISIIEDNCVEKKKLMTHDEMMNITVIAESTSGPTAVNCATYVGYKMAGMVGTIIATIAIVLPSFFVILLITALLNNALKNKYVQAVLSGLKPCVVGIVFATGIFMVVSNCIWEEHLFNINTKAIIITACLGIVVWAYKHIKKKKLSPIALIVISSILGIIVY